MLNQCYRLGPSCHCVSWTDVQCQESVTPLAPACVRHDGSVRLWSCVLPSKVRAIGTVQEQPITLAGIAYLIKSEV